MEWLKQGVNHVLDVSILSFLTWEEVELRACGAKDIETAALKAITDTPADNKWVKMFWQMFETLTQEERRKYLKFVWGRVKLPNDTSALEYRHEICVRSDMAEDALPEAHTCFFTVDIPEYESLEIMTKRFRTAIELCGEIDADYGADDIADEDGNRRARGDSDGYGGSEEEE
jgi:E3 ubiquitin-protein ligase HERC1